MCIVTVIIIIVIVIILQSYLHNFSGLQNNIYVLIEAVVK